MVKRQTDRTERDGKETDRQRGMRKRQTDREG